MHELEPFDGWLGIYDSNLDERLPFFGENHDQYDLTFYNHILHPEWDFIGSETLFVKVIFADYQENTVIIEMIGEWNDTLHNDCMHLKRNLIDFLLQEGITRFLLIGENVLNFHGAEDDYYQEWNDEIEDSGGWIIALGFRDFIWREWEKYGLGSYFNWGGPMEISNWRGQNPKTLLNIMDNLLARRIGF